MLLVKMLHLVQCKVYQYEMMRLCKLLTAFFLPPGAAVMGGASHAASERVSFVAASR